MGSKDKARKSFGRENIADTCLAVQEKEGEVMRKTKYYAVFVVFILFIAISCLFLFKDNVKAANSDFYKKYSGGDMDYDWDSFRLKSKCKLKITMKLSGKSNLSSLDVDLYRNNANDDEDDDEDEDGELVFSKVIYGKDNTYEKVVTLPAGEYTIEMESDLDDWSDDEEEEIDGEYQFSIVLSGEYIPELSLQEVTLEEGKTKTLKVKGTNKSVKWTSSNNAIASVDNKGTVKAKKPGKATITATCDKYNLKCKVTVTKKPVTYKQLAKKMKEFAKKNKNFKYKDIDAGNECRLYAIKVGDIFDSKISSEGYFMYMETQPYIQLVKKNNTAELRLRIDGRMDLVSIYKTNINCSGLRFFSSNRKMRFLMKHTSGSNTCDYSTGIYTGKMKGYATVSTSSKVNTADLKKFNTMLGQKSLAIRLVSMNGAYCQFGIPATVRNNWKKLVKEYNTLLKEY